MNDRQQKLLRDEALEHTLALNPSGRRKHGRVARRCEVDRVPGVRQPLSLLKAGAGYSKKLVEVGFGKRSYDVAPKDRRFGDTAWKTAGCIADFCNPISRS